LRIAVSITVIAFVVTTLQFTPLPPSPAPWTAGCRARSSGSVCYTPLLDRGRRRRRRRRRGISIVGGAGALAGRLIGFSVLFS